MGQNLVLDIPSASQGLLPDPVWKQGVKGLPWYPGDSVNMGIGQGDLLATPMQMAVVAATFANRGYRVSPRMAQESYDGDSSAAFATASARTNRVGLEQLSDDDWEKMVASMEDVIHRGNQGFRGNGTAGAILDEILNTAWRVSPVLLKLLRFPKAKSTTKRSFLNSTASMLGLLPLRRLKIQLSR